MAQHSRLSIARTDILSHFDRSSKRTYSRQELSSMLSQQRSFWRLAHRTTIGDFIDFLEREGRLKPHTFIAPNYGRTITRYSWGDASANQLAQSLKPRGYLSHATAAFLLGLTDLIPGMIYLNVEQTPKPPAPSSLTQEAIDRAFSGKQRQSKMIYEYDDHSVVIINGKNTGNLAVEGILGPSGEQLRATNLERTLIDIAVRPNYAGGIFQVLEAYRAAKDGVSTNRLLAILKELDYVYPYHQAIGFLMEVAGYSKKRYTPLRDLGREYDFYLAHGIENPQYSSEWRLFFPQDFELA